MIPNRYNLSILLLLTLIFILPISCTRELDDLEPAQFPVNGDVFIDGFSAGLEYAAFGNSKVSAFQVDEDISFDGDASMRFGVPDFEDPAGAFAGGAYFTSVGRDLSGFDALTFYARASQPATIGRFGFGNDFAESRNVVILENVDINSNWQKYIIPIPDPAVLTQERGMFFYSTGPDPVTGRGYTFWVDEVKFEKLGTIAQPRPVILDGQDQQIAAETGDRLNIGGLSITFNLPNGVDQTTGTGAGYYAFTSSNPSVATVNANGEITIIDAGEAVITAKVGEADAVGSLTITSSGEPMIPLEPAPTPTRSQDSVISLFSNVYTDVLVDTYNPFWENSTALVEDVKIGDDDVKQYKNLNFVAILTEAERVNASEMTHFHIDIWTPNPTDPPAAFKVLIRDYGANGVFDGGDDSSHEVTFNSPTLQTESWVSLDIPLSDFIGLTSRSQIAQLVLSGDLPTVFVDNIYYYNSGEAIGGAGPETPAPTPTVDAANVISLFSNAYDDVPIDTWSADWDVAELADIQISGDDVKLYTGLSFAGIEFTSQTVDASKAERFHMDIWTPDAITPPAALKIKLVDFGADNAFGGGDDVEHELTIDDVNTPGLASGTWVGVDLPLTDFAGLTTTGNLAQLIISGDPNTLYVDNIYFYSGGGVGNPTEPQVAAPTPSQSEADVISLFSEAYTDVPVDTWRTDWSVANFEDVTVAGDAVKKYSELDFVGIETVLNPIDASQMTHVHVDVWSADNTLFGFKIVDFGADGAFGGGDDVEHQIDYMAPAQGSWISYDIPLSDFTGLTTTASIAQFIFVGQPSGMNTIYVDNLYFYKEGGSSPTEPTAAAPTPTVPEADVISLFSEAYTDVPVDTWRTDWSVANFEDVMVANNAVKKYSELDFVGIETVANQVDATEMTHIHLDVWSADHTFFGFKIVDFGADGAFGGGDDVEHQIDYMAPAQGTWVSYDIPLSDFTGLTTRGNVAQFILVGQPTGENTIYVDNIYFRK